MWEFPACPQPSKNLPDRKRLYASRKPDDTTVLAWLSRSSIWVFERCQPSFSFFPHAATKIILGIDSIMKPVTFADVNGFIS
jgi:hypothetical protein